MKRLTSRRVLAAGSLCAALALTAQAEWTLAIAVGWNEWVAWAAPVALDAYVIAAFRAGRDRAWALALMSAAVFSAHAAPVAFPAGFPWWLAGVCSIVPPIVAWRIHELSRSIDAPDSSHESGPIGSATDQPAQPAPAPSPDPTGSTPVTPPGVEAPVGSGPKPAPLDREVEVRKLALMLRYPERIVDIESGAWDGPAGSAGLAGIGPSTPPKPAKKASAKALPASKADSGRRVADLPEDEQVAYAARHLADRQDWKVPAWMADTGWSEGTARRRLAVARQSATPPSGGPATDGANDDTDRKTEEAMA